MTKKKFFKLYKGPGYPVDPKEEAERQSMKREQLAQTIVFQCSEPLIVATDLVSAHSFLSRCESLLTGPGRN